MSYNDDDEDDGGTVPCPYCRKEIHEDSVRCPYCEQYISQEDAPTGPRPLWFVLGVVLTLLVVAYWILNG
jgi:hypothetical protein